MKMIIAREPIEKFDFVRMMTNELQMQGTQIIMKNSKGEMRIL